MRFVATALAVSVLCANAAISFPQEIVLPPDVVKRQAAVPESVLYEILLHHVAIFHDKAEELDRQGGDGSPYRHHIASKFGLSPQQLLYLDSVALRYREEAGQVNEEIAASVKQFHAYHATLPVGTKPMLPPEAKFLIQKHNQLVLNARAQFHALIGDDEFARIDGLVKSHYRARFQSVPETGQPTNQAPTGGLGGDHER